MPRILAAGRVLGCPFRGRSNAIRVGTIGVRGEEALTQHGCRGVIAPLVERLDAHHRGFETELSRGESTLVAVERDDGTARIVCAERGARDLECRNFFG